MGAIGDPGGGAPPPIPGGMAGGATNPVNGREKGWEIIAIFFRLLFTSPKNVLWLINVFSWASLVQQMYSRPTSN